MSHLASLPTSSLLLGLLTCLVNFTGAQLPASICPEVFQYGADEQGRWYGEITLRSEFTLTGLWIRVEFDSKVELVGSTFDADITSTDNLSYLFSNPGFVLRPGVTVTLPFFVRYNDLFGAPQVSAVRLNGRALCPARTAVPRVSPCPSVFLYDDQEDDNRWFGRVTVRSDVELQGVWVKSTFDADITSTDNLSYLFSNPGFVLRPGVTVTLPFFVRYNDLFGAPQVTAVRLNGRALCPTPTAAPRVSPCPSVFLYDDQEEDNRWFGKVTVRSDVELQGVWVKVGLDSPAELVGSKFGDVKSKDNKEFVIYNREHVLKPGVSLDIPFFVKYSILSAVPAVEFVRLNARTICGPMLGETNTNTNTFNNLTRSVPQFGATTNILPLPIHVEQSSTPQPSSNTLEPPKPVTRPQTRPQTQSFVLPKFRCGIRELGERIFFGIPATIEQYPWHGAIFHSTEYICGMSLISPYHALTAAHCFYNLLRQPVDITSVNLYFGVSNIRRIRSPNVQSVRVAEVFKHPQYEYHIPRYDIAVIKFDRPVRFNERIQPVCLWQEDVDLRTVENKGGVVVGFGLTEVGTRSDQLLWGRIQVVNSDVCREVNPTFYVHLTQYSFCAGNLTKTTVCRGDSGGGMFFQKPGTEIWQVRGITSTSKPKGASCDIDYYAIFTDVAKYNDWIVEQMKK